MGGDGSGADVRRRQNEVAVFAFTAPLLLLMQTPIVGPMLFLPASAAAAFLADYLHRLPYNAQYQASAVPAPSGGAPATRPTLNARCQPYKAE